MLRILISIFLALIPVIGYANIDISNAQNQGFEDYALKLNGQNFICTNQCFIVLPNLEKNEYLTINGKFLGKGEIGYGFLNGSQIIPGKFISINNNGIVYKKFSFLENTFYSQIPKRTPIILVINGKIQGEELLINMDQFTLFGRIKSNFEGAINYMPFSPRTINFMEGPMWGDEYINKAFMPWIIILLGLVLVWSIFEKNAGQYIRPSMLFGFCVILFFWLFFDFFSTLNQIRMYQDFRSAKTFMDNGRLAKEGDFYKFLEYIQSKVPVNSLGNFIVPYPFDSEGKYHIYPYVKFHNPELIKYIFTYNPYGESAPFGFVDPTYNEANKVLTWSTSTGKKYTWNIQEIFSFGNFGKIYVINK